MLKNIITLFKCQLCQISSQNTMIPKNECCLLRPLKLQRSSLSIIPLIFEHYLFLGQMCGTLYKLATRLHQNRRHYVLCTMAVFVWWCPRRMKPNFVLNQWDLNLWTLFVFFICYLEITVIHELNHVSIFLDYKRHHNVWTKSKEPSEKSCIFSRLLK